MAITIGLVVCFVLISLLDLPELIRKKWKKELFVYTAMLLTAFLLFELHFMHVKLMGLNHVVASIVHLFIPR